MHRAWGVRYNSATTENKECPKSLKTRWPHRRDWVGHGKAVREGGCVRLHHGPSPEELDEAVKAIGSNVSGVQGDVANLADLDRLYETVSN